MLEITKKPIKVFINTYAHVPIAILPISILQLYAATIEPVTRNWLSACSNN